MFAIGSSTWPGVGRVVEEAGELTQVLGKLVGTGGLPGHWDGSDLVARLHDEVADLRAALSFLVEANRLDEGAIAVRERAKLEQYRAWHREHG